MRESKPYGPIQLHREEAMKSPIIKRSIVIGGHKTSVSLEEPFWVELKEIAEHQRTSLSSIVGEIDMQRQGGNLSSAIRLFVLSCARSSNREKRHDGVNHAESNSPGVLLASP